MLDDFAKSLIRDYMRSEKKRIFSESVGDTMGAMYWLGKSEAFAGIIVRYTGIPFDKLNDEALLED